MEARLALTDEQLAAVRSDGRSILIEAPPGAGKTRVVSARIEWLIRERGVPPADIIALVFTRSAAAEIRSRLEAVDVGGVRVETLHGFAARHVVEPGQKVASEIENEVAIDSLYSGPQRLASRKLPGIEELRAAIVEHEATGECWIPKTVERVLYRMRLAGWIPTWDLLPKALKLQSLDRAAHVILDESQDMSPVEWALALRLAEAGSVFAMSSRSQAIMGWRMAAAAPPADREWAELRLYRTFRFGPIIAEVANEIAARFSGSPIVGAPDADGIVCTIAPEEIRATVAADPKRTLILARTRMECARFERDLAGLAEWARRDPQRALDEDADHFGDVWGRGLAAISTVHGAKGKEADRVVVTFDPHGEEKDPEWEKVSYVAVSRARRQLFIVRSVGEGS